MCVTTEDGVSFGLPVAAAPIKLPIEDVKRLLPDKVTMVPA